MIDSEHQDIAVEGLTFDRDDIDGAAVDKIAASFRETERQIEEIVVRPDGEKFRVVVGRHRVLAARKVNWPKLRATVLPFATEADKLVAELIEIDENLARRKLSPAAEAILVSRRKRVFERLHPEAKAGRAQAAGMNRSLGRGGQSGRDVGSFAEAQSSTVGKSDRSVRRAARRGEELDEALLRRVRGTSLDKGEELDALILIPAAPREALIARAGRGEPVSARLELKRVRRATREEVLGAEQAALPNKKYGLILCDYPRRFNVRSRETGLDRAPDNHYKTMTLEEICALPVGDLAATDCILFKWSTAASLLDDIEIAAEWGFTSFRPRDEHGKLLRDAAGMILPAPGPGSYRSHQVWSKGGLGMGHWFRDKHEILLVFAKGSRIVAPALGTQSDSLFEAAKGEHSAKPVEVLDMLDRLYPTLPKIELFARVPKLSDGTPDPEFKPRPGWDRWGKEAFLPTTTPPPEPPPPRDTRLSNDDIEIPGFLRRMSTDAPR